jgi:hypothetical protein
MDASMDKEDTSNRDLKIRRGKGTKESHGQQWLQFVLFIAHGEG